jgi:hypothetical protein
MGFDGGLPGGRWGGCGGACRRAHVRATAQRCGVLTREVTQEPIPRESRNHLESPRLLEQM